ncbi:hypothetical protein D9M69_718910 [compost metagenome]
MLSTSIPYSIDRLPYVSKKILSNTISSDGPSTNTILFARTIRNVSYPGSFLK